MTRQHAAEHLDRLARMGAVENWITPAIEPRRSTKIIRSAILLAAAFVGIAGFGFLGWGLFGVRGL